VQSFCDVDYTPALAAISRRFVRNIGSAAPDAGTDARDGSSDGNGAAGASGQTDASGATEAGAGGSGAGGHPQDAASVDAGGTTASSGCSCTSGGEGRGGGAFGLCAALAAAPWKRRRRNRGC
jgi:MYXO-CTERM domain-containing protein